MTYKETLDYLYRQLPMYQRIGPKAFKKDLKNIQALDHWLTHPHKSFKSIHIAGTNGKGSTAHMIASIAMEAGYKVGLYTSPHYKDFRERIKINGHPIPKKAVSKFVDSYQSANLNIAASFFELSVAMAFWHFQAEKVDFAVVETGLGGRLDSTNILLPEVSVITSISKDHTNFLGETEVEIAGEKAGIIKAVRPVVLGPLNEEVRVVFERVAASNQSPVYSALKLTKVKLKKWDIQSLGFQADFMGNTYDFELGIGGKYQFYNAANAIATSQVLSNEFDGFNAQNVQKGLLNIVKNTAFQGRMQILDREPLTIADSCHNIHGVASFLKEFDLQKYSDVHVVLGMVNDKDLSDVLALLPKNARYYFVRANVPRAMLAKDLQDLAMNHDFHGKSYMSVRKGLASARISAHAADLVLVMGSTFVVAEVI